MNSAPHLLREDRPEFERILDDTLRTADRHPALSGVGRRLGSAQLRSMAMSAAVPIAACADTEYQRFVALRTELRHPSNAPSSAGTGPAGGALGLSGAAGEGLADRVGAGKVAVVSVLAPLLAATAAVILLLVGYALHLLSPEPALAEPMRNAGWTFAALAAASALLGMGGVLLAAMRNGPSAVAGPRKAARGRGGGRTAGAGAGAGGADRGADRGADAAGGDLAEQVAAARAAWRAALLERGILPFLREALADPAGAEKSPEALARDLPQTQRTPRLGYSHPRFSSPAAKDADGEPDPHRPRYSSPEYASPDYDAPAYGGPETQGE